LAASAAAPLPRCRPSPIITSSPIPPFASGLLSSPTRRMPRPSRPESRSSLVSRSTLPPTRLCFQLVLRRRRPRRPCRRRPCPPLPRRRCPRQSLPSQWHPRLPLPSRRRPPLPLSFRRRQRLPLPRRRRPPLPLPIRRRLLLLPSRRCLSLPLRSPSSSPT
jgi:hypothetical protein